METVAKGKFGAVKNLRRGNKFVPDLRLRSTVLALRDEFVV